MNTKPAQTVQADALGLSPTERIRLAYRLLESFDAERRDGSAGARMSEERREPTSPASSLSEHGIYLDGLETGPLTTDARAEPAGVVGPFAEGPRLASDDGMLDDSYADAVAALVERLGPGTESPRREPAVQKPSAPAPGTSPDLAPPPLALEVVAESQRPEPELFADWERQVANAFESPSRPLPGGVGSRPGASRAVVVTSVAGGVAAVVALGLFIKGREPAFVYAEDPASAVIAAEEPVTLKEVPTIPDVQAADRATVISEREPGTLDRRDVSDRPALTDRPATAQRPATTQRPATIEPAISASRSASAAIRDAIDSVPASPAAPLPLPVRSVPSRRDEVVPVSTALSSISRLGDDLISTGAARSGSATDLRGAPNASPFDVAPEVSNPARVQQVLRLAYPRALQEWGIGGQAEMWFYINRQGAVDSLQLKKTSGNKQLDQAALRVAESFEFRPGLRRNQPTAGWVSLAIIFGS